MKLLKVFLRHTKRYWPMLCIVLCLIVLDVTFTMLQPYYMGRIVDDTASTGNLEALKRYAGVMLILACAGSALAFLNGVLMSIIVQRFGNSLRIELFDAITHLSYFQADSISAGSLVTRVMSDTQITSQFSLVVMQMLIKPFFLALVGIITVTSISLRYGVIFSVAILLQAVLLFYFVRRLNPLFVKLQLTIEAMNSKFQEVLANLRLIRSYRREGHEKHQYQQDNKTFLDTNIKIQNIMAIMNPLMMLIMDIVLLLFLTVSSTLLGGSAMPNGSMISVIMYIQQIMMAVMTIGQIYQINARAKVSYGRILEIEEIAPTLKVGEQELDQPIQTISLRDVSFTYRSETNEAAQGKPAVQDVSFDIVRGGYKAIVGATGCGKSTCSALLMHFCDADSGVISVNGVPIQQYTQASLMRHISLVQQGSAFCSGTIADNIRYGFAEATEEDVVMAAKISQADRFVSKLEEGYETIVSQQGFSISGGQRQSIAIARALVRRPDVLILDDCTTAMDLETEVRFKKALMQAMPDTALIVIAQRISSIADADEILVMDHGTIIARGKHDGLMKQCPIYRQMYESQKIGETKDADGNA